MAGLNNLSNNIQLTTSNSSGWVLKVNNNGKDYNDEFNEVVRSTENGVGYIYSVGSVYNGSNYNAFIMKTDLDGKIVWQRKLGGSDNEVFYDVNVSLEGSDFYVYAVGREFFNNGDSEALIVKFDSSGNLVWQRKLGVSSDDRFYGVAVSLEGTDTYIYTAGSKLSDDDSHEPLIAKFDSSGNLVWQRKLRGCEESEFHDIAVSLEGADTYIYTAGSKLSDDDSYEALIVKFDSSGNLVWQKKLGGRDEFEFYGVAVSLEGTNTYIYAVGEERPDASDREDEALIAKFNSSGSLIWQKKLGGSNGDYFNGVAVSLEGSNTYIYATGYEDSSVGGKFEALLTKFDSSGNLVWQRKLGGGHGDYFNGVTVSLEDSSVFVYAVGREFSSVGKSESIIAKFNSAGNISAGALANLPNLSLKKSSLTLSKSSLTSRDSDLALSPY